MTKREVTDSEIGAYDNVPTEIAACYLGWATQAVRVLLQRNRCPFGVCIKCEGGRYTYHISPGMLIAYKRGTMVINVTQERDNGLYPDF